MEKQELISYQIQQRIIYITLNRPEKRNALNQQMVEELTAAFTKAKTDKHGKVIVLKAVGKTFCAGADLAYIQSLQNFSYEENLADSNQLKALFELIYTHPKVVIAQVEGHALAGGCGLATVCDFVFSVPNAKFGYTEVKIGFIPAIVMVFLIRKIGESRAKRLLLSGEIYTAEEILSTGLFHKLCPPDSIANEVAEFATSLCENNSETAMAITKSMIAELQSMSIEQAFSFAAEKNAKARSTADCKKGISAFLNKEKPTW